MKINKLIYFDFETTGINPYTDYIIQSCFYYDSTAHNKYIMPPDNIEITNFDIHNINRSTLIEHNARPFNIVFKNLLDWISMNIKDENVYLVAHNCFRFDLLFLEIECKRHSLNIPENWIFIDSYVQFRTYNHNLKCDNYKLITLFNYLKDDTCDINGNLHDALYDVKILKFVYEKLTNILSDEEIEKIFKQGRKSINYRLYITYNLDKLIGINKTHLQKFKEDNINTIGDLVDKYLSLTQNITEDPKNKKFFLYLKNMLVSYTDRYNITNKIKYIAYMIN